MPQVSVIVCTHNPRQSYLREVCGALSVQTVDSSEREIIIVDNNSTTPLSYTSIEPLDESSARIIREQTTGLVAARMAGIRNAISPLICFVDDDNLLAPNYLATAIEIAESTPALGAFGGRCAPRFERRPQKGLEYYLPFYGIKDEGDAPLIGPGDVWSPCEPIGAGLCVRRAVAEAFVQFAEEKDLNALVGRRGGLMLSGDDAVFSRLAARLGFNVGYQPSLYLTHLMPTARMNPRYLARLMYGHAYSSVLHDRLFFPEKPDPAPAPVGLNFFRRLRGHGLWRAYGFIFWDRGVNAALKTPSPK